MSLNRYEYLGVHPTKMTFYHQEAFNTCGAACFRSLITRFGFVRTEEFLMSNYAVHINMSEGWPQANVPVDMPCFSTGSFENAAKALGLRAVQLECNRTMDALKEALQTGPIAVQQQAVIGNGLGHMRIALGIELVGDKEMIAIFDPAPVELGGGRLSYTESDFMAMWEPLGNVVGGVAVRLTKPTNTADFDQWLEDGYQN